MKLIRAIFIIAASLAVVLGLLWVVFAPKSTSGGGDVEQLGAFEEALEKLESYGALMSSGWDDSIFSDAHSYVGMQSRYLDDYSARLLRDREKAVFLTRLDVLINGRYGQSMTNGNLNANPKLKKEYAALTALVDSFPELSQSEIYRNAMSLKKAHEAIYAFGQHEYVFSPRMNPRIVGVVGNPELNYSEPLNVSGLYNGYKAKLGRLSADRNRLEQLRLSPWTAQALDADEFERKFLQGVSVYYAGESRSVESFLRDVNRNLKSYADNDGYIENILQFTEQLNRMRQNTPSQIKFEVVPIILQSNRIYKK